MRVPTLQLQQLVAQMTYHLVESEHIMKVPQDVGSSVPHIFRLCVFGPNSPTSKHSV